MMERARMARLAALTAAMLLAGPDGLTAQTRADALTFKDKRVVVYIGVTPITGVGYDTYGRIMAAHIGKYLPGRPTVIAQNMPGAGGMVLANYLANVAPKDGTAIAAMNRGVPFDRLLYGKASTAQFDATSFGWLGSMNNEVSGFYVTDKSPAQTLKEAMEPREIPVGSAGAGNDQTTFAQVLNGVLGTRLRIIDGYRGVSEILLAMERGEVSGIAGYSWSAARVSSAEALRTGRLKLLAQLALTRSPDLPNVPLITELVKTDADRSVLELFFARQSMGRPFAAPPGVSPAVLAALREAFDQAMRDPDLIAESKRIGMEISHVGGTEIQSLLERIERFPEPVLERARRIVAAK
jgi:tripartite-type tricarboxylate transporter receptor subunit TctC